MQFLFPIWFIALAALSIPVAIHLWNIKPGKTLKIGSISLINVSSKTSRNSLKLLDIWLLVIRCLLLILIALFLAAPVWHYLKPAGKVNGWLLLPKENLKQTYQKFKPKIDSLTLSGYEFHGFESAFPKKDIIKLSTDSLLIDSATVPKANYWELITQLNNKISPGLPVYLFTPNGTEHFKGSKPATGLDLHWQTYTIADSVNKWLTAASLTNKNDIKVIIANSSPQGTYYKQQLITGDGDSAINLKISNGQPYVNLKNTGIRAVKADTTTLRIALYTDEYKPDAVYLKAALMAAVSFTGQKAIVKQYNQPDKITGRQDWLFWLSDQPLGNDLLRRSQNILRYESGKGTIADTWIETDSKYALTGIGKKIVLNKLIVAADKDELLWHDGFGRPVLSKQAGPLFNYYHLYTHFNPLWNDLVWNDDFPAMMLKLIKKDEDLYKQDRRVFSNKQVQPVKLNQTKHTELSSLVQQTDISRYFWLLLVLLFITERWLAHKKSIQTNG